MACIEARGLHKAFGRTVALDCVDLRVEEGRILGIIGPNGAGKTTALNAILGLTPYQGQLSVLGRDPWTERDQLMCDVCFISDVAVLPRWMRVSQTLLPNSSGIESVIQDVQIPIWRPPPRYRHLSQHLVMLNLNRDATQPKPSIVMHRN